MIATDERIARCEQISGFTGMTLLARLYEVARDTEAEGKSVEIGCLFGRSAVAIAYGLQDRGKGEILTCIDPFESWEGEDVLARYMSQFPEPYNEFFLKNVEEAGAKVKLIHAHSQDPKVKKQLKGPIRFAFVDGDHRYEPVKKDCELLLPLMAPGGVMAFDDYSHNRGKWGVAEAVDELVRPVADEMLFEDVHPQACRFFKIRGVE